MYDYKNSPDSELIKCAKDGDVKAFSELYGRIHIELYKFALYTMKHTQDAEDAVSDAVVKAYENIRKLRDVDAYRSWMFTILANVCRKKLKAQTQESIHRASTEFFREEPMEHPDFGGALDVRQAFDVLSEEEKLIVGLSTFGGYNSQEIGQMLRLNANTVRSKRSRALEKMEYILR